MAEAPNQPEDVSHVRAPYVQWAGAESALSQEEEKKLVLISLGCSDASVQHLAVSHADARQMVLDVLEAMHMSGCRWAGFALDMLDECDAADPNPNCCEKDDENNNETATGDDSDGPEGSSDDEDQGGGNAGGGKAPQGI